MVWTGNSNRSSHESPNLLENIYSIKKMVKEKLWQPRHLPVNEWVNEQGQQCELDHAPERPFDESAEK